MCVLFGIYLLCLLFDVCVLLLFDVVVGEVGCVVFE